MARDPDGLGAFAAQSANAAIFPGAFIGADVSDQPPS
jgi:hypothetical protein